MGLSRRVKKIEKRKGAKRSADKQYFKRARDEYIGGLVDNMVSAALKSRQTREMRGSADVQSQLPPPDRMPGFSKLALALSYLQAGGLAEECPEYARSAFEDAIEGVERPLHRPDFIPEEKREYTRKVLAKGIRLITLKARERFLSEIS